MKALFVSLILGVLTIIGWIFSPGEPVPGAEVYIEQEGSEKPVAFMQTGHNGKVTFSHIQGGLYRIKITLPQQSGKLMRGRENLDCRLQVGYHSSKKQFFIREPEGFFTIHYSKVKQLSGKNITPVYMPAYGGRKNQIVVGKFEVTGNSGNLSLELRAQKPRRFAKMVERLKDDVDMLIIRNSWQ
ncbi:MAG: carboxypeptidase-like regulatory domain-containing protein [Mariniphaga sp.]|nr:carboxypeptidase-like regulatory domain-containing protein [Mariniphaga sp.]